MLGFVRKIRISIVSIRKNCAKATMEQKVADNRLETFHKICDEIAAERSYLNKAKIVQTFFRKGSDNGGFKGDTLLWIQMLIPGATKRVFNLQNKQMLKLFARLFVCDQQEMQLDLEQEGDVSETLRKFFESSEKLKPQRKSTLYLQEVEEFLVKLEQRTKEDEQSDLLRQLCKQATATDLKMVIRIIKQDLRMNAGARHILDGLGPMAYPAYQSSRDLAEVVRQFAGKAAAPATAAGAAKGGKKNAKVSLVQVMTPISPMLANACKSVEEAFKKSPGGLYSEIKYDGERVQIHKKGNEFKFFSRNLKPVMDHKVKRFKEFIPKAFPGGGDMILDSEIILTDTVTGELLPFGTLGAHKKMEYAQAEVCLFVFDCILYDGDDLTNLTFRQRRKILEDNITPIKSYVQLSESHFLKTKNELSIMTAKVLKANLEGVVLKNPDETYKPGKRGWLKVKKDYLFGGKMADTADLVVLGAWFGSGKKGGVLSIFLMGCYDTRDRLWKTVTKVHSGLDDATMDEMHEKLMKLMERADANRVPTWLLCKKALVPDYIAKTATKMPVWEITGAEFTKSEAHTASGISIRFPRITKLRDDKSAMQANDLAYLEQLYESSKKDVNVDLLMAGCEDEDEKAAMEIDSKLNLNFTPKKNVKQEKDVVDDDDDDDVPTSSRKRKSSTKADMEANAPKSSKKLKVEKNESPTKAVVKNQIKVEATEPSSSKKLKVEKNESPIKPVQKIQTKLNFGKGSNTTKPAAADAAAPTAAPAAAPTAAPATAADAAAADAAAANESELFKDLVAYFDASVDDDEQYRRKFVSNGGTLTMNTQKATVVFYNSVQANVDLAVCRKNYKSRCRHLSVQWLRDSLNAKKCQTYPLYAVVLI